jgi:hypothetical protein
MIASPLCDPADFRIAPGIAHLCATGERPFLRQHDAAFAAYALIAEWRAAGTS